MAIKLACSTILYGGHLLETALEGIKKAGYEAIELCCIPGMAPHFWPKLTDEALKEVRKKVDASGLAIESVGASGACGDLNATKATLHAAAVLGAPYVTTATGGKSDDEPSFAEVVKTWREYAKAASEEGAKLSVKPHVRAVVYHGPSSLRFMKELDTNQVGLNYDPTHIYRTPSHEDEIQTLRDVKDYVFTTRFRDCAGRDLNIGPVEKQVCGQGVLNLPPYFAALKEVPNLKYVTLEIVGTAGSSRTEVQSVVERCAEYVRKNGLL
ncbi:MAG: sugar phosphate isomerase/epimerase [Planctomycetota bacterium]|nr:sugar phosphate isomerase/epimerase [Planctomycetota bacterium]